MSDYKTRPVPKQRTIRSYDGSPNSNIGGRSIGFSQPMHDLSTANMYDTIPGDSFSNGPHRVGSAPDTSGLPGCVQHRNEVVSEEQKIKDSQLPKHLYDLDEACMQGANDEEKISLAFCIVHASSSPIRKYRILQFFKLLDNNKDETSVQKVNDALVILEKYAINLLKHDSYPQWRVVKFHLNIIQNLVFPVKGADDVLKQMGYSQVTANAFTFPSHVPKPDIQSAVVLASDLVIARVEMETLLKNRHPFLIFIPQKTSQMSPPTGKIERGTGGGASLSGNTEGGFNCGVCCKQNVPMFCTDCTMYFCEECDGRWHSHKQRSSHFRINLLNPTHQEKDEKNKHERPVPVPRRRKVQQPDNEMNHAVTQYEMKDYDVDQQPILTQPVKFSPVTSPYSDKTNNIYPIDQQIRHPPSRLAEQSPQNCLPVNASNAPQGLYSRPLSTGDPTLAKQMSTQGNLMTPQRMQVSSFMDEKSARGNEVLQPQNMSPPHLPAAFSCSSCHLLVSSTHSYCPSCKHQMVKKISTNLSTSLYDTTPSPRSQVYGGNKTLHDVDQLRGALFDNVSSSPVQQQSPVRRKLPNLPGGKQGNIAMAEPLYKDVVSTQMQLNQSKDEWSCEHCTYVNPITTKVCQLCCKTPSDIKNHPSVTGKLPQNGHLNSASQLPLSNKMGEGTDPGVPVVAYAPAQYQPSEPLYMTPKKHPLEGGIFMVPNNVSKEPPPLPPRNLASGNTVVPWLQDAQKSREHELSEKEKGKRLSEQRLQLWKNGMITEDEYYNPDLVNETRFGTARLNESQLTHGSGTSGEELRQQLQAGVIAQEDIYNNDLIQNKNVQKPKPTLGSEEEIGLTDEQLVKLIQDDVFSQEGIFPTANLQPQTPSEPEAVPREGTKLSQEELMWLYEANAIPLERFNSLMDLYQNSDNQEVRKVESHHAVRQAPEIQAMFEEFRLLQMNPDKKVDHESEGNLFNYPDVDLKNVSTSHDAYNFHVTANVSPLLPGLYEKLFSKGADMPVDSTAKDNFLSLPNYLAENLGSFSYIEDQSRLYVEWMKQAEGYGFMPEELNLATNLSWQDPKGRNPVEWLKEEWTARLAEVSEKVMELTKDENERIGNISAEEAKEALLENDGSVQSACKSCIESRRTKLAKMSEIAIFGRADCLNALDDNNGDMEKAILSLEQKLMIPIRKRVLGNEEGGERNMDEGEMTRKFVDMVSNKNISVERRVRVIFAEKRMVSWGRAETAVKLIDMGHSVEDAIEAASAYGDMERSLRYLQQECPVCYDTNPMSQMITFLCCQDRICKSCVAHHLTTLIKERNIHNIVCPVCGLPDLSDETEATEYFNNLDIMMREIVDEDVHDLFQQKLRDRTLRKEPNFRWCAHCDNGFINEQPNINKMTCPFCRKHTCFSCKKPWEPQHEGLSCEQFALWQEENDEEFQMQGLAGHLARHGIDCPKCKFRYDLAKGGCMHFKCIQCSHEFCSGCYGPMKHGAQCAVSTSCGRKGIHAHHPRDCLFYLRDWTPQRLQGLLDEYGVGYNTEPEEVAVQEDEIAGAVGGAVPLCKVLVQKDTPNGLVDAECGIPCEAGHPLCKVHYTEYLVSLIKGNDIDPADVMDVDELSTVLRRVEIEPLPREQGEDENLYKERIFNMLKDRLPLRIPDAEVLDEQEDDE